MATIPVPDVRQQVNYSCGPSALWAVCRYFGVGPDSEAKFRELTGADADDGTNPQSLIRTARRLGLRMQPEQRMDGAELRGWLRRGHPVIMALQAWGSQAEYDRPEPTSGHDVVAISYDQQYLYLEDPSLAAARGRIAWTELERRWHDVDAQGWHYTRFGIICAGPAPGAEQSHEPLAQAIP